MSQINYFLCVWSEMQVGIHFLTGEVVLKQRVKEAFFPSIGLLY